MNIENRTTHNVLQGSDEWISLRTGFSTASEAPSALGVSRHMTRNSLLAQKATGIATEHDAATMARFARGHKAEQLARPIAESIIGDDLSPVTMTATIGGVPMLASMDGMTFDGETIWENKLWNDDLARCVKSNALPEHYTVQMDQQLAVSGARRCLFTCSDGTQERTASCWYMSDAAKLQRLAEGWRQFNHDLDSYRPEEKTQIHIGRSPDTLPALRIEVTGAVTSSNLSEFREHALMVIGGINRDLKSDADFVDAEQTVKWCVEAESRLKAAKDLALSQTESIEQAFRVIDDVTAEIRTTRLELAKLVKAEKDARRTEKVMAARTEFDKHVARLQLDIKGVRLMVPAPDFGGAIKGLSSLASIDEKLTAALIAGKAEANTIVGRITNNLRTLDSVPAYAYLFADRQELAYKDAEVLELLMQKRVDAEQARIEAERERIRLEEERKAQAAAEQAAEAERQRIRAEEQAKAQQAIQQAAAPAAQREQLDADPRFAAVVAGAPAAPAPAPWDTDEAPTLKLGDVNARLAPIHVTADGLRSIGIEPAGREKNATLYRESQFAEICQVLVLHLQSVVQLSEATA